MKVKSLRIPNDIEQSIEYIARREKLEESQSLRKLARLGFEYYIAKAYEEGRLALREAARLLHMPLVEVLQRFHEMGIKGNVSAKETHDCLHTFTRWAS